MALKSDGTVWTWGNNTYGQLGDDTDVNRITPKEVILENTVPPRWEDGGYDEILLSLMPSSSGIAGLVVTGSTIVTGAGFFVFFRRGGHKNQDNV